MKYLALLSFALLFSSCDDDLGFCDALIVEDLNYIADYIDDILEDLEPIPESRDILGHEENLWFLVDEINKDNSCLAASIVCYACIKTYPAQSEILIDIDDGEFIITRIIDISTPEIGEMYFEGMHNP